ncbi:Protein of unknown function [Bacillus mycoides]|nr:Protein of unknown function [Bacillus mycoides]
MKVTGIVQKVDEFGRVDIDHD